MSPALSLILAPALLLVAGGLVYYCLVIAAAIRFRSEPRPDAPRPLPSISVLKPLAGLDLGLRENLQSFFELDYPDYELLLAVREPSDRAVPIVEQLQSENPHVRSSLTVSGEPPPDFPNAKVYSLAAMARRARHSILVISDSDIRAHPDQLHGVAADFADSGVGVVTYPYRAVPGRSLWSFLEALGMNSEFWAGVLVARFVEGMQFAVGPTMAIRRSCLDGQGGFESVKDYLAEDFVLGRRAAEQGYRAELSHHVVEHHIGAQSFSANLRHRLRWHRSTRRSRPAGYVGQIFTHPLPFAILSVILAGGSPWSWATLAVCAVLRIAALLAVSAGVLDDSLARRYWWAVPLQDLANFVLWILAFFGNEIVWRNRKYRLLRDGRLELLH
jgi:ceramide glucosyltransferase